MSKNKFESYRMRPMGLHDIEAISHWFEHLPDLSLFDRKMPVPLTKSALGERWKESLSGGEFSKSFWFTINDECDAIVGIVGIDSVDYIHGDGVLALYFADHVRRKGLGIRASAMLIDIAFGQLRLNRMTSYYRSDNDATRALTGTLGFEVEGKMRRAWFTGGKHHDVLVIGLLASEWAETRANLRETLKGGPEITLGRAPWSSSEWSDPT